MTVSDAHHRSNQSASEVSDSFVPSNGLRVALVHDWLTGMRGGEKVLEMLCTLFPDAPLWTLLHVPGSVSSLIEARTIHTSLLQRMPRAEKRYRSYLPLYPAFAELTKVCDADLVISTSHAVAKAMVKRRGDSRPFHICYIHTPMRYAWDMFDAYFGPERVGRLVSMSVYRPIMNAMQVYDRRTSNRVDLFVANSRYVADRVQRFYGREAIVLPPPVDTEHFLAQVREPEDWYLVVSALVPYKRVDDTIRACTKLGRRLKIVGTGPEETALKRLAADLGGSVQFAGRVSDHQLGDYYRRARALLFPGIEDFGIVPVEAIACGCPVVALKVGGILDSMSSETAVFYQEASADSLAIAIADFESREACFSTPTLRARASTFSQKAFLSRMISLVNEASSNRAPIQAHQCFEVARTETF